MEREDIEALVRIYESSKRNLRHVAELAEADNPDSVVAHTSRAKANTYAVVIDDLNDLLARKKD
jgi:hypothetical protein